MTSVAALEAARRPCSRGAAGPARLDIVLLGCGTVGSAFAALATYPSHEARVRISHVLVRDRRRQRTALPPDALRVDAVRDLFSGTPDVLVELLGGLEPARTLILEALHRRIPVVTANKSLIAAHGPELRAAANRTATPLLYEAAVIAGVPFLNTFARRVSGPGVTGCVGIVNGTSNYVLTRARLHRGGIEVPLREAQQLGYAEPDPSNDIDGVDPAEKLIVLLQHFAALHAERAMLETGGIRGIDSDVIDCAADLNGVMKPVIWAEWSGEPGAFAGPAFVPATHVLAGVDDAENAIVLTGPRGRLVFRGPGAGPDITAATVMDDVLEAAGSHETAWFPPLRNARVSSPDTAWLLLVKDCVTSGFEVSDLLASYSVYARRTSRLATRTLAAVTWPVPRSRIETALHAVRAATGCDTQHFRALEA